MCITLEGVCVNSLLWKVGSSWVQKIYGDIYGMQDVSVLFIGIVKLQYGWHGGKCIETGMNGVADGKMYIWDFPGGQNRWHNPLYFV